jgi:hypothetical protein
MVTGHSNICLECSRAAQRRRYLKNRANSIAASTQWIRNNRSKYNLRTKLRRRNIPEVGLAHTMRSRIRSALPGGKGGLKTLKAIGLPSFAILRLYIESQWLPGMSWENYGRFGWHVDHILPIDSFDLSTECGRKKAFIFTNLQPLWATDNHSKGARLKRVVADITNLSGA